MCLQKGLKLLLSLQERPFSFSFHEYPFGWKSLPTNMKTVPSSELHIRFQNTFLSRMIFLFQRWDMNNSFLGIGISSFLRLKNAALRSFFLLGKAWRICCLFWQAGSSKKTPRHSYRLQFPNSQYPGKAIQQIGGKLSIGFFVREKPCLEIFGNFGMMMTQLFFFVQNFPSIEKKPAGFFTASAGEDTVHYEFGRLNHWTVLELNCLWLGSSRYHSTCRRPGSSMVFLSGTQKTAAVPGGSVDGLKTRPGVGSQDVWSV